MEETSSSPGDTLSILESDLKTVFHTLLLLEKQRLVLKIMNALQQESKSTLKLFLLNTKLLTTTLSCSILKL
jgi:hypothetical protein